MLQFGTIAAKLRQKAKLSLAIVAVACIAPTFSFADMRVSPARLTLEGNSNSAVLTLENTGIRRERAQIRIVLRGTDGRPTRERAKGFLIPITEVNLVPGARQEIPITATDSVRRGCYSVLVDVAPPIKGSYSQEEITAGMVLAVRHNIKLCV